jgi:ubiquinone/menaquinone biosynthesis C-methylase UbiE
VPKRLRQPAVVDSVSAFNPRKIKRVLDLGCGAGRNSIYLAKRGVEIVGIDTSASALRLAGKWANQEKLCNVEFLEATMTNIPFGNSQFDAVISISVIHHALKKDIAETTNEVHRVLKKRGIFLANLTSVDDPRYGVGEMVEAGTFKTLEAYERNRFWELHHFFTRSEAIELLACFSKATVKRLKDRPNYWKITAVK